MIWTSVNPGTFFESFPCQSPWFQNHWYSRSGRSGSPLFLQDFLSVPLPVAFCPVTGDSTFFPFWQELSPIKYDSPRNIAVHFLEACPAPSSALPSLPTPIILSDNFFLAHLESPPSFQDGQSYRRETLPQFCEVSRYFVLVEPPSDFFLGGTIFPFLISFFFFFRQYVPILTL